MMIFRIPSAITSALFDDDGDLMISDNACVYDLGERVHPNRGTGRCPGLVVRGDCGLSNAFASVDPFGFDDRIFWLD